MQINALLGNRALWRQNEMSLKYSLQHRMTELFKRRPIEKNGRHISSMTSALYNYV